MASAETQTSGPERACLAHHARDRVRLVEIGVWHGVTTRVLLKAMESQSVLYAVDPYPPGRLGFSMERLIASRELKMVSLGRIRWVRLPGAAAAERVLASGPVDFVFVDGDHSWSGISSDWSAWSVGVKRGGVVALHDSVSSRGRDIEAAGSVRFTREVVAVDKRFELIETVDSLTVWRRTAAHEC